MIRINLNTSRVPIGSGDGATTAQAITYDYTGQTSGAGRQYLIKFAVIILGVVGLWIYEKRNIDDLTAKSVELGEKSKLLKSELAARQADLAKLKDIEPLAQSLTDKLHILRDYSKLRLENLQSLDYLQSVIPERVWLKDITYKDHHYEIVGNAMDTVDLTDFVNKLEGGAYFSDVIVVQDKEKSVQGGKIRDFEVTARSGVAK